MESEELEQLREKMREKLKPTRLRHYEDLLARLYDLLTKTQRKVDTYPLVLRKDPTYQNVINGIRKIISMVEAEKKELGKV